MAMHGTIGGRTVLANGHSDRPILGPALDGAGDVAAIRATPQSTQWHGDANWDHAVGPLQFISSTWATWGSDGDRDGTADPNDLDDAAYAAARFLCANGQRLDAAGEYVESVYDAASAYATRTS